VKFGKKKDESLYIRYVEALSLLSDFKLLELKLIEADSHIHTFDDEWRAALKTVLNKKDLNGI